MTLLLVDVDVDVESLDVSVDETVDDEEDCSVDVASVVDSSVVDTGSSVVDGLSSVVVCLSSVVVALSSVVVSSSWVVSLVSDFASVDVSLSSVAVVSCRRIHCRHRSTSGPFCHGSWCGCFAFMCASKALASHCCASLFSRAATSKHWEAMVAITIDGRILMIIHKHQSTKVVEQKPR